MHPIKKTVNLIKRSPIGKRLVEDGRYRAIRVSFLSLAINLFYALFNGVIGFFSNSLWLITMCAYYLILSVMRFCTAYGGYKSEKEGSVSETTIMKVDGWLLVMLTFVLGATVYLAGAYDVVVKHDIIVMITIATYTFYNMTLVIIHKIHAGKTKSTLLTAISNIGFVNATVSMLSLQRSMLASFGQKSSAGSTEGLINNIAGIVATSIVMFIGIQMIVSANKQRKEQENGKVKNCKCKRENS